MRKDAIAARGCLPDGAENPGHPWSNYVVFFDENDASFRGIGMRPRAAKRALLHAIAADKRAKAAGDARAMREARERADRRVIEHLERAVRNLAAGLPGPPATP
jgi:hypothetical protein